MGEHEDEVELPLKRIPGGYGWPYWGAIRDRLDFFWFQGETQFWESRLNKYKSTIFRCNVAPSPPGFPTSKVIMLLDQKSFPVLFDVSKVEKKDLLLANYMPSTRFYGGIRPCVYLDPSEDRHKRIKSFIMDLIKLNAHKWVPEMDAAAAEVFPAWEEEMKRKGKAQVNAQTGQVACNVLVRTIVGRNPVEEGENSLKTHGPFLFQAWIAPQLSPVASAGLPHLLEELLLHTFPVPYFFVSIFYRRLVRFFQTYGSELLDMAEIKYGLDRHDALHNIVFFLGFNAFGGFNLFFPPLIGYVGRGGHKLHEALAAEVREGVKKEGGGKLSVGAINKMELLKSVVFESLRLSHPVPYQYGRAKEDFIIETYDGRYEVKKGEIIGGCQPMATRDPKVFKDPNEFVPDRFVGEEGRKLLKYVLWGNGPADGQTSVANKQCAAAELVPFLSQTLLACLFLRYDSFTTFKPTVRGNQITVHFSSLNKAS
ncbi:hypothetical protein GOP47_0026326 [Adiantum capillus-veneris]|nr:hypothetical protein GOP47_0026326 [Adiantum capillus-veneris]